MPNKKPGGYESIKQAYPHLKPSQILFVGDRLLTDVAFANMNGMPSVFCRNIISSKGDNSMAAMV